ncbi:MAG: PilZ domain-containing protein [Deltaproteobacteria bacterium]|nr:PilZ domain-containing protein [Deltaproteobacteria bacterium]
MARKKSEPKDPGGLDGKVSKRAPSVTTFLSKISTPKARASGGNSPAKDLLGGVTRGDLAAVGRGESPAAGDDNVVVQDLPGATFEIELNAQGTDGSGRARGRIQERVQWQGIVDVRGVFAGPIGSEGGATRAKDVSSGGVFVETAHLLEVGDPVVLSFPGDDGKRVVVSGRVRWVTPFGRVDDPTPGMGIEFVGVDKNKRAKLDSLLSRARA